MKIIKIAMLVGGFCLINHGIGVTTAVSAPPAKEDSSLSGVTQNWDKNLTSGSRFTVLTTFSGTAVRDNNTGLVWEQTMELTNHNWFQSLAICANKVVGGTAGWRLPSVIELKSVQDMSVPYPNINSVFTAPGLAAFNNWWSATTSSTDAGFAWIVDIGGRVNGNDKTTGQGLAWCVRGPMSADAY